MQHSKYFPEMQDTIDLILAEKRIRIEGTSRFQIGCSRGRGIPTKNPKGTKGQGEAERGLKTISRKSEMDAHTPNKANAIFFCPPFLSMVDRDREPLIWEAISLSHDGLFLSSLLSSFPGQMHSQSHHLSLQVKIPHHHAIDSINNRRDYRDTSPDKEGSHEIG